MPPIDPQQLLRALGPLLTPGGGIRGAQEASRIASLMKDATKLVTRCIYLNILRVTESQEALQKFIEVGGWNTLNNWLDSARSDGNDPFLGELLEVYLVMPVTVVILKQNSAAKTIKQLSKTENEKIKILSSKLVDIWTKTIRGQNNSTEEADEKKKKKKHKEKEKEKEKEKNDKDKENDKKEKEEMEKNKSREKDSKENRDKDKKDRDRHKEKDRSKREKSKSSTDSKESSSKSTTSDPSVSSKKDISSSSKKSAPDETKSSSSNVSSKNLDSDFLKDEDSKKRPKTVKMLNTKFRSTGLFDEEEEESDQGKKKEKLPAKRISLDTKHEEILEKKPRLHLTMPTLAPTGADALSTTPPEVTHGRIKLIAPKRAPAHEIQESNVFINALQQSTLSGGIKRKKKQLASPSTTSVPLLLRGVSGTSPPPVTSPLSATSPPQSTQSAESGPTSPPLLSPTTVMAQKLPSVPSFYRDTLEDLPESSNEKKEVEKGEESPPALECMQTDENVPIVDIKDGDQEMNDGEVKVPESKPDQGVLEVNADIELKPVKAKKPKKNVTWAREANLEEYFYFELDETERENVNRPKTFNEMKKEEMMLDRRAMESAKRFNNDTMVEVLQWKRPKPIDNVIVVVEAGCNSVEKQIQMDRELVVLCALYFNKVPDTPNEPDPEISNEKLETQNIPLEDENGSCTEYEHTYHNNDPSSLPYDPEFGGLPLQNHGVPPLNQVGPMSGLMGNMMGNNMNNNMAGNNMGNMNIPPHISHILNTLQQQAQETRDPVILNLQGMLSSVLQSTNPQDSGMLVDRILNALEPFKNQIPGLSNLINSVTGNGIDPNMGGPRFMGPNQMGNPRHGLLGSAPPGFNMMGGGGGGNMRPNVPGPGPMMGNNGGMGGNYYMGGGGGMRMGGPPNQWRGRSRPFGKRGGQRNVVCQFYVKKGNCKYGDICQFIHPGPSS
ncbi:serine/threonine-protein phosphatase 1 regulatory subunit 10-like isoform X2 [Physella acuta]|uniref:serine/threonine-protein phosphatase 1 regulatory subunit 10-like isoform X2 n=1 Tax=Physella acuta TaxID=109671 RepID=UPI0027DC4822|nr:serine/threonine-protein phosphatase 1 regulatory subunit 10-like isoform X2 [Physella acuta]